MHAAIVGDNMLRVSRALTLRTAAARRLCSTSAASAQTPSLVKALSTQISLRGPMTIKEFMAAALTHPKHGYYMRGEEVFGRSGDFVTSPELSQVFGELIGVWCVACWEQLGRPPRVRLIEAGPGRGTLMADLLRSTSVFPRFHEAASVHLIEISPHLRAVQRAALAPGGEGAAADDADDAPASGGALFSMGGADSEASVAIEWHESLDQVPHEPEVAELIVAHEFLDALPVHQLVRTPRGWRERMVGLRQGGGPDGGGDGGSDGGGDGALPAESSAAASEDARAGRGGLNSVRDLEGDPRDLDFVLSANPTPASVMFGARLEGDSGGESAGEATGDACDKATGEARGEADGEANETEVVDVLADGLRCAEFSPGAISFVQLAARRLSASRGAALIIDYGEDAPREDSLRGILGHRFVHPLHAPGHADLSVDVDFAALRDVARDEAGRSLRCPPLSTQRDFLAAMGIEARVNALLTNAPNAQYQEDLLRSAHRLVGSPGMGTAYKAFALVHADVRSDGVPGFGEATLLDDETVDA